MELLTQPELDAVMAYPDEARHHAWVTLLAQGRVTIDMIRTAEGLEPDEPVMPATVIDDYGGELGGEYGTATLYPRLEDVVVNPDLTAGVAIWSFRFGRAFFWVLLALGAVTLIRLGGRVLGLSITRRGD